MEFLLLDDFLSRKGEQTAEYWAVICRINQEVLKSEDWEVTQENTRQHRLPGHD